MNMVQIVYLIFGIVIVFTLVVVILIVAGKDIWIAFKRRFNPRGADIYIANLNRNMSHYYTNPKDGIFRINGLPYIANPSKIINLTYEERNRVNISLKEREERLQARIEEFEGQKKLLNEQLEKTKLEPQRYQILTAIAYYDGQISELRNMKSLKEENYFRNRRAAYLFLEGDPIPKNLHEFQSVTDSKILDNIIARIKTEAPGATLDKDLKTQKMILLGILLGCAIAAFFAWRNQQGIELLLKAANLKMPGIMGG